jgi:NADPH:quinone reductase-like Zn-dependent oxidoreductase
LTGAVKDLSVAEIFGRNLKISGITVGSRLHAEEMIRAIEVGRLTPVIDRHFPLEQLAGALRLMSDGGHFGKIVIDIAN